jgi:DME family drug/metabolite transporter
MVAGRAEVPNRNIDPRLLVVAAAMLWGTTGTARALGPDAASPAAVGAMRLIVGGALLAGIAWWQGWFRERGRRWGLLPTVGAALAMAAYQPFFFGGVARTGVAVGTVVGIGSTPVFAGILGILVRRERPARRWYASTALALAGTVLLVTAGEATDVDPLGVTLAVGAGASYAVFVLATKLLLDAGHSSDAVIALSFALAGVALVPVAVVVGVGPIVSSPAGIAMAAHLGILTVALAYLLFGRGLVGVGVGTAGTLTLAEPATAATLGLLVLGERPGPAAFVGLVMIAAGIVMLSIPASLARPRDRARHGREPLDDDGH